jgi:DNA-binding CsgD family transcriptional regulator
MNKKIYLSPYEERICRLRLGGMSGRETAIAVGRAEGTVRNDFTDIYRKLGIRLFCQLGPAFMEYQILRDSDLKEVSVRTVLRLRDQ